MDRLTCLKCQQTWPAVSARVFRSHACLGAPVATLDAVLEYLDYTVDSYGCFIADHFGLRHVGYQGKYLQFRPSVARLTGEAYVHRTVWKLAHSQAIPAGMHVSHECAPPDYENSRCANPDHLVLRTPKQNHAYMSRATRARISSAGGKASPTKFQKGVMPANVFTPGHVPWNKQL